MRKLKTIYDRLKPEFKTELQNNVRKYDSAKRLKYKLMIIRKFCFAVSSNFSGKIFDFFVKEPELLLEILKPLRLVE